MPYFVVTGGVGSHKGVIGRQISLAYGIPLLFAECYYTQAQLDFAIAVRNFDYQQGFDWSKAIGNAMKATGGCVMVCPAIRQEDMTFVMQNKTTTLVYADASSEAVTERWNAEKNIAENISDRPGSIHFNDLKNLAGDLEELKSVSVSNVAAAAAAERELQEQREHDLARAAAVEEYKNPKYSDPNYRGY